MNNPNPVNLTTADQLRKRGWAAEARDSDGHLHSTVAWIAQDTQNGRAKALAEFITEYATDCVITIFPENIKYD